MLRAVLIAYLSLATVFGPLLCCCNMPRLFGAGGEANCCKKSVAAHAHNHHDGHHHSHHHDDSSDTAETNSPEKTPVNHEHEGEDCPCGRRDAKFISSLATQNIVQATGELHETHYFPSITCEPVCLSTFSGIVSNHAKFKPAGLYGREMLRAYQILRC